MTGFGTGEAASEEWSVAVELSGVNRKQLDLFVNLPQSLAALEPEVRRLISSRVSRGRVNARFSLTHLISRGTVLMVDHELARQYLTATAEIAAQNSLPCSLTASDLLRAPGIFKIEEATAEIADVESMVRAATEAALGQLIQMQEEEGRHLLKDVEERLASIEKEAAGIASMAREVVTQYRESLLKRLAESGLPVDCNDERILREIALYAERSDTTEEIIRIGSHLGQFRKYFVSEEPAGRPLDFLCQELHRELNTIGSKCNHAAIAQAIVNAKTELEKIREQVQNLQ